MKDTPSHEADAPPTPMDGSSSQARADLPPEEKARRRVWWAASVLYRRRWLLAGVFVVTAIGSVILSLLLPKWYLAETRVLLPEGGGALSGMLSELPSSAAALLGGEGGDYVRYLAILDSRTTMQAVVERFDLVEVYEIDEDAPRGPVPTAIEKLRDNVSYDVSLDYNYLALKVYDQDPRRAAQMANYFVEVLNERNMVLTSAAAAENRSFLEQRLQEANAELDSTQAEMQALQERHGVIEFQAQGEALMGALAQAQAEVARAEVRYETLLNEYGPENPRVTAAQTALSAARGNVAELTGGGESLMPTSLQNLPGVARRYASITQEILIQQAIIQQIIPLYESARMNERLDASAVQVVDPAVPPEYKAKPKRALVVIGITLSTFLFVVVLLLVRAWMKENATALTEKLRNPETG